MHTARQWLRRDARDWQIAVLASLLATQLAAFDFGASPAQAAATLAAALATQAFTASRERRPLDVRSPLVTGLSLTLLLRSHDPAVWLAAPCLAIGSKWLLRVDGRHVFNPACLAIVAAVASGRAWVSPGQWGALTWSALLLGGGAALVLGRARRVDTAVAFFGSTAALLGGRALWLGDPLAIPLHQMESGALLIFGLFMITDPRTTPARRGTRVLFAAAVAALAFWLQFGIQLREGLFFALALLAPAVPLLDRLLPQERPSPCASPVSPFSPASGWSAPRPPPARSAVSTWPARTSR